MKTAQETMTCVDAVTGETTTYLINKFLKEGEQFSLIGNATIFTAIRVWTCPYLKRLLVEVIGSGLRTVARVCDTRSAKPIVA